MTKASYSRSVTTGITVVLQQHRLRPPSPSMAALNRGGHTVRGMDGVNDDWAGQWVTTDSPDNSGLFGIITDLGG